MGKIDSRENLIRLINQYQNLVFSICLRLTGDYFISEDITQDTFISAYQHMEDFDGEAEKAWICRIASNKCIDWQRAAARRCVFVAPEEMPEEATSNNEPLGEILNNEVMENFKSCLNMLDEPYRSVADSHFLKGKTAKEISESTGVGLKTIQTQIYRAKEMLKKAIRKEELLT